MASNSPSLDLTVPSAQRERYRVEKHFFTQLGTSTTRFQTQKILNTASRSQLECLCYIIHCIITGIIPIKETHYDSLCDKKKITYLFKHFKDFEKLKLFFPDSARPHLLEILYKIVTILPLLSDILKGSTVDEEETLLVNDKENENERKAENSY